jgi:hypothetical protein
MLVGGLADVSFQSLYWAFVITAVADHDQHSGRGWPGPELGRRRIPADAETLGLMC